MRGATGFDSYTKVLLANPISEELKALSKKPTNLEHRRMAERVQKLKEDLDLSYSKCASLFRE